MLLKTAILVLTSATPKTKVSSIQQHSKCQRVQTCTLGVTISRRVNVQSGLDLLNNLKVSIVFRKWKTFQCWCAVRAVGIPGGACFQQVVLSGPLTILARLSEPTGACPWWKATYITHLGYVLCLLVTHDPDQIQR